jgi:hypothetical protein
MPPATPTTPDPDAPEPARSVRLKKGWPSTPPAAKSEIAGGSPLVR